MPINYKCNTSIMQKPLGFFLTSFMSFIIQNKRQNCTTCKLGQSLNTLLTFPGPVYSQVVESFWQPPLLVSQGLMGTQCFPSPTNPCSHVHRNFPLLNKHFAFASQMPGAHTPAIHHSCIEKVSTYHKFIKLNHIWYIQDSCKCSFLWCKTWRKSGGVSRDC